MSATDAIADFIGFMEANGVVPIEPIAQRLSGGSLIRFRCEGDGKGRQNGWAILYLDERPAGAFGNYRLNTGTLKWKSSADRPTLTQAEREALQREWRAARERREAERANNEYQAALAAADLWNKAKPADSSHGYVEAKGINPAPLRMNGAELLVPMFAADGTLWNLQRIWADGTKRFLKGGRVDDLFTFIGQPAGARRIVIAEGYATADAIHRATDLPVVVAFNTGNLPRIARLWNERRPDAEFVIAADDDERTAQRDVERGKPYHNPGIEAAEAAAAEIGARVAYPSKRAS